MYVYFCRVINALKTPPFARNTIVAILSLHVERSEYFKIITIHAYAFKRQHALNTLVCLQYVQIYTFFFFCHSPTIYYELSRIHSHRTTFYSPSLSLTLSLSLSLSTYTHKCVFICLHKRYVYNSSDYYVAVREKERERER